MFTTSVAFIPGHGTPTLIIIGRNQRPLTSGVRAVLGRHGEPRQPDDPAKGKVWESIISHVDSPGWEDEWITVADVDRKVFATHPWSLGGGGAIELLGVLEESRDRLRGHVKLIGRTCHTGADDAYFGKVGTWTRFNVSRDFVVPIVEGEVIRDWCLDPGAESLFPYDSSLKASLDDSALSGIFWNVRSVLGERREPGGTHEEVGLTWYEFSRWHPERYKILLGIAFPSVATHNHFVLDRGGRVFKQSAPVIKLPEEAGEDDHLLLLGVLNSSTACFWLKQKSYAKTGADNNSGGGNRWSPEPWFSFYDFSVTTVEDYPLPKIRLLGKPRKLDSLARELAAREPSAIWAGHLPSREEFATAHRESGQIRSQMISIQEELDWEIYRLYGLVDDDLTYAGDDLPGLTLGERAFEIALARSCGEQTAWFERHGSTPITEIPAHWPTAYRNWCSVGLSSSPSIPTSGCSRSPSTSGGGRRSRGRSGRSGRCGTGCWTGSRTGGSGPTPRSDRRPRAWRSSPTT